MGLKEQVMLNGTASEQAASTPSGCKACQREGIAIYPLRAAVVPESFVSTTWHPVVPKQDAKLSGGEFKYALRTLRAGYVYVLLNKKIWQGYQVTAEGFLRQFNPHHMPEAEKIESLSQACLTQHHDIQSSFINIAPGYKEAAIAFSSDPWSETVLDEYKSGKRPTTRFTQLTLSGGKVTADDASRSLTIDASLAVLKKNVAEFAASFFGSLAGEDSSVGGAHGFYPRTDNAKQIALGYRITNLAQEYKAPVNAIILDDVVGVVQEINYGRMDLVNALAEYQSKPVNYHKKTISDIILKIRGVFINQIAADPNITEEIIYIPDDLSGYRERIVITRDMKVESQINTAMKRLEEYYNETKRADFARSYKARVDDLMRKITSIAKDLEAWYRSELWLNAIRDDYSPDTSSISWAAQMGTIASCIQGDMVGMNKDNTVWESWMNNPDSPPFMSLLGRKVGLVNAVFAGTATFSNLKAVLNSPTYCDFINSLYFDTAAGSLVMSMSGAFSLVGNKLSEKARAGFERVMQAVAYISEGEPAMTIFSGEITVREYQNILRRQLGDYGNPVWSRKRRVGNNSVLTSSRTARWLRVTDPEILEQKIQVRFASLLKDIESPAVKKAARHARTTVSAIRKGSVLTDGRYLADFPNLIPLKDVADNTLLTGDMKVGLRETLKIVSQQYDLPRRVLSSNGVNFVLAAVMLALQRSALDDNIEAVNKAVPGDLQAGMRLSSSALMVVASAAEMVGTGHTMLRWGANPNIIVSSAENYIHPLCRAAGVICAVASIVEGIALFMDASDASQHGDSKAALFYALGGVVTVAGGGIGIYAAAEGAAFFGPAGWAIALLVLGAVLTNMAASEVRTPLEVWLTCTCFGNKSESGTSDFQWDEKTADGLQKAIKAFYTVCSGVVAQIERDWPNQLTTVSIGSANLGIRVELPGCSATGSDWLIELTAKDDNGRSQLLTRNVSPGKQAGPVVSIEPVWIVTHGGVTYRCNTFLSETWEKFGLVLEGRSALDLTLFTRAELKVTYWPDKTSQDDKVELTVNWGK